MRLTLDENLGQTTIELFQKAGHDVSTVLEQQLTASSDQVLLQICRLENRCIVTLDLNFGNPLLFKPSDNAGMAVFQLPNRPSQQDLKDAAQTLIAALSQADITGKRWIVQAGRIREYQEENVSQ